MTVKLYQKKNKIKADGTAPIYYVLYGGGKRRLISSEIFVAPNHFDNIKGRVGKGSLNSVKLNNVLRREVTRIEDIIFDFKSQGLEPSTEQVITRYSNNNSADFFEFAYKVLANEKKLISFKTYTGYKNRLDNLKKYRQTLSFAEITPSFLKELKSYFKSKGRSANGYYQDFAVIRKFYKHAVLEGVAKGNPFEKFKFEKETTFKAWLRADELKGLENLLSSDQLSKAEENTLRHFLFSCFSGIRFGDKLSFTKSNVIDGRIQVTQNKTGKLVTVPFSKNAKSLLPSILGKQLKLSNSRVNADLKRIMGAAGIEKEITYHCSRHTFAITCILAGVNLITVRDWLGHTTLRTTQIYANIAKEYQEENILKYDEYLEKIELQKKGKADQQVDKKDIQEVITVKQEDNIKKAMELKSQGLTNVAIGKILGVSETAVRKWIKKVR